ncbi:MAG: flavodoxin domain-containing protein [Pseudonocardiaceae bacterium]
MTVLVAYASKHGATRAIAERIAATLTGAGRPAEARPVERAGDLAGYDAFVIGSAAYYGHWRKAATKFVRTHTALLAKRPVWLFSSGPLGTEATDEQGNDLREAAVPKEISELRQAVGAREHRVFFGALAPNVLSWPQRLLRRLPAGRALLPEGDFRDWADIDAWARAIAHELSSPQPADPGPTDQGPTGHAPP